jgi:hypothetical protein
MAVEPAAPKKAESGPAAVCQALQHIRMPKASARPASYSRKLAVIPDKPRSGADPESIIERGALRWIPGQARNDDVFPRDINMFQGSAPGNVSLLAWAFVPLSGPNGSRLRGGVLTRFGRLLTIDCICGMTVWRPQMPVPSSGRRETKGNKLTMLPIPTDGALGLVSSVASLPVQ